jgi:hypothetical protein
MPNNNGEVSIKRWVLFLLPVFAFLGGGLVYSVTIGSMYGRAITRLDTVERVATGNLGKNLQLEEVMRSEVRAIRDYMFALNTNIVVIGTALNIAADKLQIINIEKAPAHKGRINE